MELIQNRQSAINKITRHIPRLVNEDQNTTLMRPITMEEVETTIKQTPKGKSPRLDRFTAEFFHDCWDLLKNDIWKLIENSKWTLGVLPVFNATFLTLIPKEENSLHPKVFRPIALYNVIFKIITKIIANWLKPLLSSLISKEKIGYVEGRQILDNVLLTHELIHSLKLNKLPSMFIKQNQLAISQKHPSCFRLSPHMDPMDPLASFLVLFLNINQWNSFPNFQPFKRNLTRRPFISLSIYPDGKSPRQIHFSSNRQPHPETPFSHGIHPPLSHTQFVDDTMLMASPTLKEAHKLKTILDDFSEASGTSINEKKY